MQAKNAIFLRVANRACERSVSGAENGAERAENGMSGREQSGERVLKNHLILMIVHFG